MYVLTYRTGGKDWREFFEALQPAFRRMEDLVRAETAFNFVVAE